MEIVYPLDKVLVGGNCEQSSTSRWSSIEARKADASLALRDVDESKSCFHTDFEAAPWWQINFGRIVAVDRVVLFNREIFKERLNRFEVLASIVENDSHFENCASVLSDEPTGKDVVDVSFCSGEIFCRVLRIRLTRPGFLHFRRFIALGRDLSPAEIDAVISKVALRRLQSKAFNSVCHADVISCGGLQIAVDRQLFPRSVIDSLISGQYELLERCAVSRVCTQSDVVVELGSGIGVISMEMLRTILPGNLVCFEANSVLIDCARRTFAINGVVGVDISNSVLKSRAWIRGHGDRIRFRSDNNFLASRVLLDSELDSNSIQLGVSCLEDTIERVGATILVCDIEGDEVELLCSATLEGLRVIVVEVHPNVVGKAAVESMVRHLVISGFSVNFQISSFPVLVFERFV